MPGPTDATATELTRDVIAAVDRSGQLADVLDQPNHVRDALWRVETANLPATDAREGLIVAGMGGSAIGGALAAEALGDRTTRPLMSTRDYGLPAWATPEMTVLCASYSGDTEETLTAYEAAGAIGCPRVVATSGGRLAATARADGVPVIPLPGGFQPRHAVAYMTVVALEVAALVGVGPGLRTELDVAAAHLESLVAEWGPEAPEDSTAKGLARELVDRVPVVVGAGLTTPIAYRWKTQLNENAKVPAFAGELPEADHNEIEGWSGAPDGARFAHVFLDDCDLHPRVCRRVELTRRLVEARGMPAQTLATRGGSRIERLFSLTLLGDLVSLYLAALRGVDPGEVQSIESLKRELERE